MKKSIIAGLTVGLAAGTAAVIAGKIVFDKISREVENNISLQNYISPNCDNTVTLFCGSSKTAKGLTYVKIIAGSDLKEDECKLVVFAGKNPVFSGEREDNEHFKLLIGNGKYKQCCDVSFEGEEITAHYYPIKI